MMSVMMGWLGWALFHHHLLPGLQVMDGNL